MSESLKPIIVLPDLLFNEGGDIIPPPVGQEPWQRGHNAVIKHYEEFLGCEAYFKVNSGRIGWDLSLPPNEVGRAHTSFHNHLYGQTFIFLEGNGSLVVTTDSSGLNMKEVSIEPFQIIHIPGGFYHQIRLPKEANLPIVYICVSPAEGIYTAGRKEKNED